MIRFEGPDNVPFAVQTLDIESALVREIGQLRFARGMLALLYDLEGASKAGQVGVLRTQARSLLRFSVDTFLIETHLPAHAKRREALSGLLQLVDRQNCMEEVFGVSGGVAATAWHLETSFVDLNEGAVHAYLERVWQFVTGSLGFKRPASIESFLSEHRSEWARITGVITSSQLTGLRDSAEWRGLTNDLMGHSAITDHGLTPILTTSEHVHV